MSRSRARRLSAALAALLALALLLIAVPAALVAAAGWPLPTELPTLTALQQATRSAPSPAFVADVLAVIAWAAWLQLAVAVLAETAALIARRPANRLPLLPGIQTAAAKLVATAAFLGAVGQQPAALADGSLQAALASPVPMTIVEQHTVEPLQVPAPRELEREAEPGPLTEYRTGPRDTWWQLAETHLDDGLRWRELRDLNLGRHVTPDLVLDADHDTIDEGWSLLLPAGTSPAAAHPVAAQPHTDERRPPEPDTQLEPEAQPEGETPDEGETEWTVTEGDHFWSIAENNLTDTLGRAPTDDETVSYWRELIDANQDRLLPPHDPDLIYPGQELALPEVTPTAPAPGVSERADGQAAPPEATAPGPKPEPAAPSSLDPSSNGDASQHGEANNDTASPTERVQSEVEGKHRMPRSWTGAIDQRTAPSNTDEQQPELATDEVSTDEAADRATEVDRNAWGLPADLRAGLAASALAAAGITALIRRRRRQALQQRPAGLRLPTPAPDVEHTVRDLDAATPGDDVLEDLTTLLCSIPPEARPALVTTTDDGEVTLLFGDDTDPPPPPAPWQPTHPENDAGPVGWHATLGDHGPIRSIGLPLLATLGRRQERNVLANLAALGTLHIDGDPDHVRRRLRAVALEIATSRTAGPVEVLLLGEEPPVDIDQLRSIEDADAEIASAKAEHDQDVVPEDRTIRLLVAHQPGSSPTIPDDLTDTFGVLAAGPHQAGWLLEVADHTGRLRLPDGGSIDLDLPAFEPDHVEDALALETPTEEQHEDEPETADVLIELIEPAFCEIRILGTPTVIRNGQPVEGINGKALEVITYIATHRDGATAEQLEDAVWNGRATATGSQRVRAALARARELLGDGPDGQPLVPRRTKGQQLVRLSDHVATDLDRALGHLKLARTLPNQLRAGDLRAALDLVRGQPFQGWPLSWTTDVHQRAVAQLQDAALELAKLCRIAGKHDAAITAIEHGLQLCDPAEALYVEWARIEADRGRTEQVRCIWERLCRTCNEDTGQGDAWAAAPAPTTDQAFAEFLAGTNHYS